MPLNTTHVREILLYTILTLGGVIIDLGVANFLVYMMQCPLVLAGIFGLLAGTITNYFIHTNITFKNQNLAVSWRGFWKYVQTCLIGAGVRVGALALFNFFSSITPIISLVIATGLSFSVNYLLSRYYVFRPHP